MKHYSHYQSHQNGVYEQQRGGDARSHIAVAEKQRERRQRYHHAEKQQRSHLATLYRQAASACLEHYRKERNGEKIAEKQHGVRVHAVVVEW